jgi:hypothetical protein
LPLRVARRANRTGKRTQKNADERWYAE